MCGVTLLNKATDRLKREYGLELKVGIEIEFNIYRKVFKAGSNSQTDYALEPIESNTYACANALISLEDDFVEIASQLEAVGITIEAFHKECGKG